MRLLEPMDYCSNKVPFSGFLVKCFVYTLFIYFWLLIQKSLTSQTYWVISAHVSSHPIKILEAFSLYNYNLIQWGAKWDISGFPSVLKEGHSQKVLAMRPVPFPWAYHDSRTRASQVPVFVNYDGIIQHTKLCLKMTVIHCFSQVCDSAGGFLV